MELLLEGSQKMTSNLDMNSKKVINLSDPSVTTDAINKKYVDTIVNDILKGSETFQGDINMKNNHIKNVHTPTSNNGAVNKAFCETTYKKILMIIGKWW